MKHFNVFFTFFNSVMILLLGLQHIHCIKFKFYYKPYFFAGCLDLDPNCIMFRYCMSTCFCVCVCPSFNPPLALWRLVSPSQNWAQTFCDCDEQKVFSDGQRSQCLQIFSFLSAQHLGRQNERVSSNSTFT